MARDLKSRIQRIQRFLGVEADGIIGVGTVTALEQKLFGNQAEVAAEGQHSLTVSRKGLEMLVSHEISTSAYYRKFLSRPVFPGGQSGVTLGIGYDLGYNSEKQIRQDWGGKIADVSLERLLVVCGLKGNSAGLACNNLGDIEIPIETARDVFYRSTLPRFAAATAKLYPGVEALYADAQAGLLSLVYNRGASTSGERRREMKAIKQLVVSRDYAGIAEQIVAMKRLWQGQDLQGLLDRRDQEANLVRNARQEYADGDLVRV